ncbi:uncharacterized protein LOC111113866 [Crassostrea virginica]
MTGIALLVCCGWTLLRCLSVQAYETLALHQPAWQSSTWRSSPGAERAVDGQYTDLAWYGGQCAVSDDYRTTAEWRVDLGAVRSIHHIVIHYMTENIVWGCSSPGYYGENCSLECPQNCQNGYCDIVDGTCFRCSHQYIGPTCEDCPEGLYGSKCLQNCSMTCGDPGRCDIMTGHCNGGCQIGWTGAMCETENLALHQPAWQSDTWWSYTADLAVDGRYTDLAWDGGQCAASGPGQTTAEWRVDLGAARSIHHIVIQYATGNIVWDEDNPFTSTFMRFSVYISNTTNKEDGVLCFRDTNYTNATIPNPVNITCPYHGRYVIYYNNRTHPPYPEGYSDDAYTDLCEVEVYGCSSSGHYGGDCSLECPQNCQNGYCDIVEGTCFGCSHQYIGPTCEDCPSGLYGSNCSQNCSMTCGDPGNCDIMTGHCNGGCQVGWTGIMCEKG